MIGKKRPGAALLLSLLSLLCACGADAELTPTETAEETAVRETEVVGNQEETPAEQVNPTETKTQNDAPTAVRVRFQRTEPAESALIEGLSEDGKVVWSRKTEVHPVAQLDRINPVGVRGDGYFYVEDGVLYKLDLEDGSVLWSNDSFGGSAYASDFGADGSIYLTGYFGPDLCVIGPDGTTKQIVEAFDENYFWPAGLRCLGDRISLSYDSAPEGSTGILLADPETGTAEPSAEPAQPPGIRTITATSWLEEPQYGQSHRPDGLCDGALDHAWVEGAEGQGIGESVTLTLTEPYALRGFRIHNGYQKSEGHYLRNSRPAVLELTFSNGSVLVFRLEDIQGEQVIPFEHQVIADQVTLTVREVYPGSDYEDTAISELSLY